MRLLALLAVCAVAARGQSAVELLERMRQAYAGLSAVHIKATRTDSVAAGPEAGTVETKYELAEKPGRYRAYLRRGDLEALAVSDGTTLWKALPKLRQWSKEPWVDAPGASDDGNAGDIHARLRSTLLGSFVYLAQSAQAAEVLKPGRECHVVRLRAAGARHDLCIDKVGYLVREWSRVESKGVAVGESADARMTLRVTEMAVNEAVPDGLFAFTPDPKWRIRPSVPMPGDEKSVMTGRPAPEFNLKSLAGDTIRLSDLRGTVVFLDFWATWCPPCREEMPLFERLQQEFEGKVRFVLPSDEDPAIIRRYIDEHPTSMLVLIDPGTAVQRRYGAYSLPTSFVIGRDGTIRQHFVGVRTEGALRRAILRALAAE